MKTILNINLTDNQYKSLVAKVMRNTRRAWEADEKGDHANGVLSGIGKVSCQMLYNIYRDDRTLGLALSPETVSAINFVNNCIQVSEDDCKSFINSYLKQYDVTIFGMEMSKKEAESVFENLINEYDNMVDATVKERTSCISSSLCLLIKTFLDAGIGKVVPSGELLIRMLAKNGDMDEAKVILTLSLR